MMLCDARQENIAPLCESNNTLYDIVCQLNYSLCDDALPWIETFDSMNNNYSDSVSTDSMELQKYFDHDDIKSPPDAWRNKLVKRWTTYDVINWIIYVAKQNSVDYENINMSAFSSRDGNSLCELLEGDFQMIDPNYGHMLYKSLESIINNENSSSPWNTLPSFDTFQSPERNMFLSNEPDLHNLENLLNSSTEAGAIYERRIPSFPESTTNIEPEGGSQASKDNKIVRKTRGPGRPPKDKSARKSRDKDKKCGRLWEFIRDLLKNPEYCPSLICWENPNEGVFRFVRSEKVAELWGRIKDNPKMTYEKLSRAMRHNYKNNILEPVLGRRLVYKFGPKATKWRPHELP